MKKAQVEPLHMSGMKGRKIIYPARGSSKRTIVLISGMHTSHERMSPIANYLAKFGTVISPDLPGIGGMDSLYTVGKHFTLDEYAKLTHQFLVDHDIPKKKNVVLVSMSFGFLTSTRMLQIYPEASTYFTKVISIGGFGRWQDFQSHLNRKKVLWFARVAKTKLVSSIIKNTFMRDWPLKLYFRSLRKKGNVKYNSVSQEDYQKLVDMELSLWKNNDTRTRFAIYELFCTFDLTKTANTKITAPLHNLFIPNDQWVDAKRVNKTLHKLYEKIHPHPLKSKVHAPSVVSDEKEIVTMFGDSLEKVFK